MKTTFWIAAAACAVTAAVLACSSSSSGNGGGGGAPTCQNPSATGAGSTGCNSCLQAHCASELASVESSCQAYIACYQGCQCSDTNCLLTCFQTKIDATCQNAAGPQTMCLQQNCEQVCTTSVSIDGGGVD